MGLWSKITGAPDRADFVAEALARMRGVVGEGEYDEAGFCLKGGGHTMFLANYWADYQRAARRDRGDVLAKLAANLGESRLVAEPSSYAAVRAQLRPQIRDRAYWMASARKMRLAGAPPDQAPPIRPFGAHLMMSIAVDMPTSMRNITPREPVEWGHTFEELLADATANIAGASEGPWRRHSPGVWISPWHDGYSSSRLVVPALFRALAIRGAPVVVVSAPDLVLVTGADDPAGLVALAALAAEQRDQPRALAALPVTLVGDRWVELVLPAAHPAHAAFNRMRYQELLGEYSDQCEDLRARTPEDGLFHAKYMATQRPTGSLESSAALTLGVATSLPVVDSVTIVRPPEGADERYEPIAFVPWAKLAAIVELTPEPEHLLPRFATSGDISAAQMSALVAASEPV